MIDFLLVWFVKAVLWLRYRVRVTGLDAVLAKGNKRILFLPNHPGLIDPIVVMSQLFGPFKVRALANEEQIDRFFIRWLCKRVHVLPIPDISHTKRESVDQVREVIRRCVGVLKDDENLMLYPSGHIARQNREVIGGNSAVERILKEVPDARVVLVRTCGLWGSRFGWADGHKPIVKDILLKGLKELLLGGLFFMPRREVVIEVVEPEDFPKQGSRSEINGRLEAFYNAKPYERVHVPYTWYDRGGVRVLDEVAGQKRDDDLKGVAESIREQVRGYLEELSGVSGFDDEAKLASDLGLDSLAVVEIVAWIEGEYGFEVGDVESLVTVGDVMLAASGEVVSAEGRETTVGPVGKVWFSRPVCPSRPEGLRDMTVAEAFLTQAKKGPGRVAIADQKSGVKTYRDVIVAVELLRKEIEKLEGEYIGIMVPASAGVTILYLATVFAGKVPVMVNWTLGRKNLTHTLESLDVKAVLTSQEVVGRLKGQGVELADVEGRFVYVEDIGKRFTLGQKLWAVVKSRFNWNGLESATIAETAAVLFTSGSENVPKAVPLTHKNILANVWDAYDCFVVRRDDSILGILPPFHSFGLTISMIFPLSLGMPVVFYPVPTHGGTLGQFIKAYGVRLLVGTPTFLKGILRASSSEDLNTLRLVVSGAEKCPMALYEQLEEMCPQTVVLEGYGVTECSPVISVNREDNPMPGTIGKVLDSLEAVRIDPETGEKAAGDVPGILMVRGDSVFGGYLNYEGESPFVVYEGKQWYRTGDLVVEDRDGVLTFSGRLKRFIKLGGEMISLPAIETVLLDAFGREDDEGPALAVVAEGAEEDKQDIVLVATRNISREEANGVIREAGMSGLHNVRRIVVIDELPLLGTGKVDYRGIEEKVKSEK